jgi:transposase-like protein
MSHALDVKSALVARVLTRGESLARICRELGVSRTTAYAWLRRYQEGGPMGLVSRSRRPKTSPTATPEDVIQAVLEERDRSPTRGPRKLAARLQKQLGVRTPSPRTIARILRREGRVTKGVGELASRRISDGSVTVQASVAPCG